MFHYTPNKVLYFFIRLNIIFELSKIQTKIKIDKIKTKNKSLTYFMSDF